MEKLESHNLMNRKGSISIWIIWAGVFLLLSIISGILGFGLVAGFSLSIAKWLAVIFVILFIITLIAHTIKNA